MILPLIIFSLSDSDSAELSPCLLMENLWKLYIMSNMLLTKSYKELFFVCKTKEKSKSAADFVGLHTAELYIAL